MLPPRTLIEAAGALQVSHNCSAGQRKRAHLVCGAAICHMGSINQGGHYVAVAWSYESQSWYVADDTLVRWVSLGEASDLINRFGYILFYRKQQHMDRLSRHHFQTWKPWAVTEWLARLPPYSEPIRLRDFPRAPALPISEVCDGTEVGLLSLRPTLFTAAEPIDQWLQLVAAAADGSFGTCRNQSSKNWAHFLPTVASWLWQNTRMAVLRSMLQTECTQAHTITNVHLRGKHWVYVGIFLDPPRVEIYDSMQMQLRHSPLCTALIREFRLNGLEDPEVCFLDGPYQPTCNIDCAGFAALALVSRIQTRPLSFTARQAREARDWMAAAVMDAGLTQELLTTAWAAAGHIGPIVTDICGTGTDTRAQAKSYHCPGAEIGFKPDEPIICADTGADPGSNTAETASEVGHEPLYGRTDANASQSPDLAEPVPDPEPTAVLNSTASPDSTPNRLLLAAHLGQAKPAFDSLSKPALEVEARSDTLNDPSGTSDADVSTEFGVSVEAPEETEMVWSPEMGTGTEVETRLQQDEATATDTEAREHKMARSSVQDLSAGIEVSSKPCEVMMQDGADGEGSANGIPDTVPGQSRPGVAGTWPLPQPFRLPMSPRQHIVQA